MHFTDVSWGRSFASDTLRKSPAILCMKDASASQWACSMRPVWSCDMNGTRQPAQLAIEEYIAPTATAGWQGRPHTTLPTTLDNELQGVGETAPPHWNYRAYTTEEHVATWSRPTNSHTASTKLNRIHYSARLTPRQEATRTSSRKNAVIRGLKPISSVTASPTDGTICVMMSSLSRS